MSKDTGGPAFPYEMPTRSGMTLRDYFAAQAMNAVIGGFMSRSEKAVFNLDKGDHLHAAKMAYRIADALLEARE